MRDDGRAIGQATQLVSLVLVADEAVLQIITLLDAQAADLSGVEAELRVGVHLRVLVGW